MESVTSLLKTAGTIKRTKVQVIARADVAYDQAKGRVFISLDASVEPMTAHSKMPHSRVAWLPERKHVTHDLPREQAVDFAQEVFAEWFREVRASIPSEPISVVKVARRAPLATTCIVGRVRRSNAHHV